MRRRLKLLSLCVVATVCASWVRADQPIMALRGDETTELAPHGLGNVYAPEIHRHGDKHWMWYGGQGKDGHDRIHFAESTDGVVWRKRGVAIDNGAANHVNDPSVVRAGELWWMFYTVAAQGELDEIAAASSADAQQWNQHGVVFATGKGDRWDSGKVGRPSVIFQDGKFRMWYDGQPTLSAAQSADPHSRAVQAAGRAVGYAESADGMKWERRAAPVLLGAGAVHVVPYQQSHVMVYESRRGTLWASSLNGIDWKEQGMLLNISGSPNDAFGHVTPFLHVDHPTTVLYFGAASRTTWDGNAIAATKITLPAR